LKRPIIGITTSFKDGENPSHSIGAAYVEGIGRAGGVPVLLACTDDLGDVASLLDRLDGVLLVGGPDIDPAVYRAEPHPETKLLAKKREDFDLALARDALERDMPIMGICLGCQEVNVAAGGTLVQHVPDLSPNVAHAGKDEPRHDVRVEPGSLLHRVLGCERITTNSSHHQAIDTVGEGFCIVARSADDGIIEAAEAVDKRFALAIQWHPERLLDEPPHQRLFDGLVAAARAQPRTAR